MESESGAWDAAMPMGIIKWINKLRRRADAGGHSRRGKMCLPLLSPQTGRDWRTRRVKRWWCIAQGTRKRGFSCELSCDWPVFSIGWHDNRGIGAGCKNGTIKVFDARSGDCSMLAGTWTGAIWGNNTLPGFYHLLETAKTSSKS